MYLEFYFIFSVNDIYFLSPYLENDLLFCAYIYTLQLRRRIYLYKLLVERKSQDVDNVN